MLCLTAQPSTHNMIEIWLSDKVGWSEFALRAVHVYRAALYIML